MICIQVSIPPWYAPQELSVSVDKSRMSWTICMPGDLQGLLWHALSSSLNKGDGSSICLECISTEQNSN
ncbi:hypothetical protein HZ326_5392 [Fusarium oxysporum f. sp. albedinis]|nr:hypothetical protein HZ326_5392 [Fusarium oxysporum f. sp. albedinis]